ncbi:hypothetical protein KEM52_001290 [Ascosphaera acerosa]|nr:hypothetical protein KEM52_001290 [Ascosphaera acerosa]
MPALLSKGHGAHSPPAAVAVDAPAAQHSRFGRSKSRRNKSSLSGIKIDLHESHAEKEARRLKSYADPNMAVQGLEPGEDVRSKAVDDKVRGG